MAQTYDTLQIAEPQPHTLLVTLNRPEVANAMNTQMGLDLLDLFHAIGGAPNEQRCIVLTGAGRAGVLRRRRPEGAQRHDRPAVAGPAPDLRARDPRHHRTARCRSSPR